MARFIDHTLLKPDATQEQIIKLCLEARDCQFASVCVNPTHVNLCAQLLSGTGVEICTVVGFPLGANTTAAKIFETQDVVAQGATEVDMVINVGALKSKNYAAVLDDIAGVTKAAHEGEALVKVIIEAALLTDEEKVIACQLAQAAGAAFVKTSTGFGPGGATVEDVALMRKTVGPDMGVKAAGGVRTLKDALAMIAAGATRIGASAGVALVEEANK
ncbi:MAG: deoxyribose-phosphate aldolase [Chloroflexi bacterium]|nr:MAG: deoxyribose-phosphate aldolase [Chloroflexota bacterium]PIE81241.1 MAG: deoxyribose-phosphate aldolase [Chloroflexota bacterium]